MVRHECSHQCSQSSAPKIFGAGCIIIILITPLIDCIHVRTYRSLICITLHFVPGCNSPLPPLAPPLPVAEWLSPEQAR